ncbi:L-dopachrome tautomerase yellow-f-like [Phlebotomus argentipes]|uniref:L-dopachrome tautomerase yellow-f-like n=1 Tax=Phlebotomus argentipes TaxID=94469 RepID=UPI0028933E4A|nr:L-dopachrome tautomerase yellow-f-like [Phlebotomus argentipes]
MVKNLKIYCALFLCFCFITIGESSEVEEVFHWKEVIFEDLPFADDTLIGPYPYNIPSSNDVQGINYHAASGLMIATVGRLRPGVPSNLNAFCTSDYDEGTSPHLWGFPNYARNTLKASFYNQGRRLNSLRKNYYPSYFNHIYADYIREHDYTIVSVYYPHIDERCNRLFVLDTGYLHYSPTQNYDVQNPALLVYDLPLNGCRSRNFPLIRRVEIPNHLWTFKMGLDFISFDYQPKGSCEDLIVYISNVLDNSLVVYDYKRGDFWTFADESMKPILSESILFFKTFTYFIPLGITNVVLGYPDKNGDRNLYYSPGSSVTEYIVSTKLLKDKKASYKYNREDFTLIGYRGCGSEAYRQVFDPETGVIFFGESNSHRISCWNTRLPFNPDTIGVVFESDLLLFPSELFLDSEGFLWFLTNQLPLMFNSADILDTTEINSRLFRVKASEAVKGTICDNLY